MEIKEEGASEEGQHFLPTAQANETRGTQFTSIQKIPNEPQLEFILGKEFHFIYTNKYKTNLYSSLQVIYTLLISYFANFHELCSMKKCIP
uniref:Uncharacterized protein n=1 Tax=Spermophilus dauricus TaxID=99837 RepID=A0A8C9Q133_SPEDA